LDHKVSPSTSFKVTAPVSLVRPKSYAEVVSESSEVKEKTKENIVVATPFVVNTTITPVSNLVPTTSSVVEAQTNENAGKTTNEISSNLKRISNEISLNTEIHSVVDDIEMKEIEAPLNEISLKDCLSSMFKIEDEFMEIWMNATKAFKNLIVKRQLSPFIVSFCNLDDICKSFGRFENFPLKTFMESNEQQIRTSCKVSIERMTSVIELICEINSFGEILLIVADEIEKANFPQKKEVSEFLRSVSECNVYETSFVPLKFTKTNFKLESSDTWIEYVETIDTSEMQSNVEFVKIISIELLTVLAFCYRKKNKIVETEWNLETIIKLVDPRVILVSEKIDQLTATDIESKEITELPSLWKSKQGGKGRTKITPKGIKVIPQWDSSMTKEEEEEFMKLRRQSVTKNTLKNYQNIFKRYVQWWKKNRADESFLPLSEKNGSRYIEHLLNSGYALSVIHNSIFCLHLYLIHNRKLTITSHSWWSLNLGTQKIFLEKLKFLSSNYDFEIRKAVPIFFKEWKMIVSTLDISRVEVCQLIAFGNLLLISGQRPDSIHHILLNDLDFKRIHLKDNDSTVHLTLTIRKDKVHLKNHRILQLCGQSEKKKLDRENGCINRELLCYFFHFRKCFVQNHLSWEEFIQQENFQIDPERKEYAFAKVEYVEKQRIDRQIFLKFDGKNKLNDSSLNNILSDTPYSEYSFRRGFITAFVRNMKNQEDGIMKDHTWSVLILFIGWSENSDMPKEYLDKSALKADFTKIILGEKQNPRNTLEMDKILNQTKIPMSYFLSPWGIKSKIEIDHLMEHLRKFHSFSKNSKEIKAKLKDLTEEMKQEKLNYLFQLGSYERFCITFNSLINSNESKEVFSKWNDFTRQSYLEQVENSLKDIGNLDKSSDKSRDFRKRYSEFFKLLKEDFSRIQESTDPFHSIVQELCSLEIAMKGIKKNLKFTSKEYVRICDEIKRINQKILKCIMIDKEWERYFQKFDYFIDSKNKKHSTIDPEDLIIQNTLFQ
jgi:hypothetical protein